MNYPIIWETVSAHETHAGKVRRRIAVYSDRKVRETRPLNNLTGPALSDQWPVLYRKDVPHINDEDWIACPGADWYEVTA